ncbi:hypothetical protein [Altererythrobacter sp.]|uniref:hypothetical protein n=1 Tax=Altererythrobacter sp. TaxID=1872480 RepID=UPI003D02448C
MSYGKQLAQKLAAALGWQVVAILLAAFLVFALNLADPIPNIVGAVVILGIVIVLGIRLHKAITSPVKVVSWDKENG